MPVVAATPAKEHRNFDEERITKEIHENNSNNRKSENVSSMSTRYKWLHDRSLHGVKCTPDNSKHVIYRYVYELYHAVEYSVDQTLKHQ